METKLIMTLLVRDEEDVVENNICFHLNHGVDYIVAADNNSIDKTPRILEKYARKGVLSYEFIKENTKEQSRWVSAMAKKAVRMYGATHLFHCDADEFWYPKSGDLKSYLPLKDEVFNVPVINYLPEKIYIPFIGKRMIVVNPFEYSANTGKDRSYRFFLYQYPRKIMTTSKFTKITRGNHSVVDQKRAKISNIDHIHIHHFPVRSLLQFKRKVRNGGSSYEYNLNRNPSFSWHVKEWYCFYKVGLVKDVYDQICLSSGERRLLRFNKVIQPIAVPRSITYAKIIYRLREVKKRISERKRGK